MLVAGTSNDAGNERRSAVPAFAAANSNGMPEVCEIVSVNFVRIQCDRRAAGRPIETHQKACAGQNLKAARITTERPQ